MDAAANVEFDSTHGLQTGGVVELFDLTLTGENQKHGLLYAATRPEDFNRVLKSIDIDFNRGVTFIDLGCGMGRTLALAAHFPFRRIVGVEFAKELTEIAEKNLVVLRSRYPDLNAEAVWADAAQYELPNEPLVLYIFNSFGAAVVRRVAERVHQSWSTSPRPIIVAYMNPVHQDEFDGSKWLKVPSSTGCLAYTPS